MVDPVLGQMLAGAAAQSAQQALRLLDTSRAFAATTVELTRLSNGTP
jgi:hypothetical protein